MSIFDSYPRFYSSYVWACTITSKRTSFELFWSNLVIRFKTINYNHLMTTQFNLSWSPKVMSIFDSYSPFYSLCLSLYYNIQRYKVFELFWSNLVIRFKTINYNHFKTTQYNLRLSTKVCQFSILILRFYSLFLSLYYDIKSNKFWIILSQI